MNNAQLVFLVQLLITVVIAVPSLNLVLISPQVVPIITNSTVEPRFSSVKAALADPVFTPDDLEVTFEWSADANINYVITGFVDNVEVDAAGIPLPSISPSGTVSTTPQQFAVKFNCTTTGVFTLVFILSFYDADTNAPLSKSVIYLSKDCRLPGCSDLCEEHGSCNYNYGECTCDQGFFGTDCNIVFQFDSPSPYCPTATPTITWQIPEDIVTPNDWISVGQSSLPDNELSNAQWFYLNTGKRLAGFYPASQGSYTMKLSAAGQYRVVLLSNDGFNIMAEQTIVVSNWTSECTGGFDCRTSGCQSGACDATTGQCKCEAGHFWYDCSLGCSGIRFLNTNDSVITDGGDNRPSTGFNVSCGWLVTPPEPFDNITVMFDTFEVSENNPLVIYQGNSSKQLLSVSGQDVPKSFVTRERSIFLQISARTLGYRGFSLNYFTQYTPFVMRAQISVDWDSAAGLAMTILTGVMVLVITASFITIFVKREHFVVKASSFVFTGMIMGGLVLGACTVFTFIGRVTSWQCVLRIWLAEFGFIFVFGCLFLKNWRIYRIFTNKKMKVRVVKDSYLFKIFSILLAFEAVLCTLWTALDYPDVALKSDDLDQSVEYYGCQWTNQIFPIISIFAKVILIGWGVFISYKSRTALTYYSEAKYAGVAIYNFSFCLIIFIPLLFILERFYFIWWILSCTAVLAVIAGTTASLLWRLFFFIVRYPDNKPPSEYKTSNINLTPVSATTAAGYGGGSVYSTGSKSGTGGSEKDSHQGSNNITGN